MRAASHLQRRHGLFLGKDERVIPDVLTTSGRNYSISFPFSFFLQFRFFSYNFSCGSGKSVSSFACRYFCLLIPTRTTSTRHLDSVEEPRHDDAGCLNVAIPVSLAKLVNTLKIHIIIKQFVGAERAGKLERKDEHVRKGERVTTRDEHATGSPSSPVTALLSSNQLLSSFPSLTLEGPIPLLDI